MNTQHQLALNANHFYEAVNGAVIWTPGFQDLLSEQQHELHFFEKVVLQNTNVDIQACNATFISSDCRLCHQLNTVTGEDAAVLSGLSSKKE